MSRLPPKLRPSDLTDKRASVNVDGQTWSYFDFPPPSGVATTATAVLIHGWPDQAFAWRYQIPLLQSLGVRCIALECAGYGDTGAPSDLRQYGFRAHANAVRAIARAVGAPRIVLGGHDWGGAVVYRVAQWWPELVSHVFSVCTPFWAPNDRYLSTETLVKGGMRNFGYQLQLASEEQVVEGVVKGEKAMGKFLNGMYGGRTRSGRPFFTPEKGLNLEVIEKDEVGKTPLLDQEELDYYVSRFMKNGIHGPLNWYRTRKINFDDDLELPKETRQRIKQPTLFILASKDAVLTPELSKGMAKHFDSLTRGSVPAGHWALWEAPDETNALIKQWFQGTVLGGQSKI